MNLRYLLVPLLLPALSALAEPATYTIDPMHTYPSFEADHMGISTWRGKMTRNRGTVVLDKATGTGTLEVTVDLDGIDFGLPIMNSWARGKDFFDVQKHPHAFYKGSFKVPTAGQPTPVLGELTLHGVTRPVELTLHSLKCIAHPLVKRDYCGADVLGRFMRDDFGLDMGKAYGFKMDVELRIQVEALADR
jgi:polyisoprenoid-binding protein YceI